MKNVLCFGDSNTYGMRPDGNRYAFEERWTGILQAALGAGYRIIEEGMCGRTTVWEDPFHPNRRGLSALPMLLESHTPLDCVLVGLGTNDCKSFFHASPAMAAQGIETVCREIKRWDFGIYLAPQIVIISPVHIGTDRDHCPYPEFDVDAPKKSRALSAAFQKVAYDCRCGFFDAALVAGAEAGDQIHMGMEDHRRLAMALSALLRTQDCEAGQQGYEATMPRDMTPGQGI